MPPIDRKMLKDATVEFLAMALFVYFGTGSAVATGAQSIKGANPDPTDVARVLPIALVFGFTITTLVYGIGHISGGHINPAVTIALALTGDCEPVRAVLYIVAQLLGSILGSLLVWGSTSELVASNEGLTSAADVKDPPFSLGANALNEQLSTGNGLLLEIMGTLLLCLTVTLTVLHPTALSQGAASAQLAPLPIGLAVFVAHVVLIPFTGCGINPARTFGPAVVNSFAGQDVWEDNWIYYVGPVIASIIAAVLHRTLLAPEVEQATAVQSPTPEEAPAPDADVNKV